MLASALTEAIYQRLVTDTTLTDLLAEYDSAPAIFVDERVPEDAETPYVHTHGFVSNEHFDTKVEDIEEIFRDIGAFVAHGSQDALDQIDTRIHNLLHRHELTVAGAFTMIAQMSGPIVAPTDEYIVGSIHTLRLRYEIS